MRFELGQVLPVYDVVAKNYGADHANKIHSDEGAAKYGFAGALVPGVGLYAYLTRPVADALKRVAGTRRDVGETHQACL